MTRTLIPVDASSIEIDRLVREQLRTNRALYTLDMPTLERLQPDLIVTQALCNVCAVAEDEVRAAACHLPGSPQIINLEPQTLTGLQRYPPSRPGRRDRPGSEGSHRAVEIASKRS